MLYIYFTILEFFLDLLLILFTYFSIYVYFYNKRLPKHSSKIYFEKQLKS